MVIADDVTWSVCNVLDCPVSLYILPDPAMRPVWAFVLLANKCRLLFMTSIRSRRTCCRLYWDLVMLVLLLANMITLPVAISFFNDDLSAHWIIFNGVCDTVFLTDLIINFRTGTDQDSVHCGFAVQLPVQKIHN